jgi:hypothetical protein
MVRALLGRGGQLPMIRLVSFAALLLVATAVRAPAYADDPDAAAKNKQALQRKLDAAKTETCERMKPALAKNKTCPTQATAAAQVTCSPAGLDQLIALQRECSKAAADRRTAAPPAARPCTATLEDGAALASLETPTFAACVKEIRTAGRGRCVPGGKKLKVSYQYAGRKPIAMTIFCPR